MNGSNWMPCMQNCNFTKQFTKYVMRMRCARTSRMRIDLIVNEVHFTSVDWPSICFPHADWKSIWEFKSAQTIFLFSLFCLLLTHFAGCECWSWREKKPKRQWKLIFYSLPIHLCISLNINSHFICMCVFTRVHACVRACACAFFCLYALSIRRCFAVHVIALWNKTSKQSKCKHFVCVSVQSTGEELISSKMANFMSFFPAKWNVKCWRFVYNNILVLSFYFMVSHGAQSTEVCNEWLNESHSIGQPMI